MIDFRNKLTKQLEIKIRSLVNQITNGEEKQIVNSSPRIDIGFINPVTKEFLNDEILVASKILCLKDFEIIPDFNPSKKSEEKPK